jgi:hypothetical protein
MKRRQGIIATAFVAWLGGVVLPAAQDPAAAARDRTNQAPVNLSGSWVPASSHYGRPFTIAQDDKTITITDRLAVGKKETYNLDGSDTTNDGHVDAVFWNGNRLIVVRDNNNDMRTEYELVGKELRVTAGGKYIAYDKKS